MTAQSAFWDRLADRYAARPVADKAAYDLKLAATRRLLRPDMDVFEFGCGTGSTALVHAPNVRLVRAIDISGRMVEIAIEKAQKAGVTNVSFEVGEIESSALPPQSFDMVMAHSILHLLENKKAAIAKAYATLKPGGYFVSSTACLGDTMPLIRFLAPFGKRLGLLPHLDVIKADQLCAIIQQSGFVIEHRWQPNRKAALFVIARKPDQGNLQAR